MELCSSFFEPGETLGEEHRVTRDDPNIDFSIYHVIKEGRAPNDRVLLDIRKSSETCVPIAGNPYEIKVLSGIGILFLQDLATGRRYSQVLAPGVETKVPLNHIYWYDNLSQGNLIIRDTCPDFKPEDEPTLEELAQVIGNLLCHQL